MLALVEGEHGIALSTEHNHSGRDAHGDEEEHGAYDNGPGQGMIGRPVALVWCHFGVLFPTRSHAVELWVFDAVCVSLRRPRVSFFVSRWVETGLVSLVLWMLFVTGGGDAGGGGGGGGLGGNENS